MSEVRVEFDGQVGCPIRCACGGIRFHSLGVPLRMARGIEATYECSRCRRRVVTTAAAEPVPAGRLTGPFGGELRT